MIGSVALLALLAVDHRVVESAHMARRNPGFWVHDDRAVDADDIDGVAIGADEFTLDDIAPPSVL